MLWRVFTFELGRLLRQLSTWLYFALFSGGAFLLFVAAAGAFGSVALGLGGQVHVNSPYTITGFVGATGQLGLLVVAGVAGQAVEQDFRHGTYPLFFTAAVPRASYLAGRLLAALAVLTLVHAGAGLGCLAGSLMPFVDAQLIGPNRGLAYLAPYLVIVLPNVLILSALFFSLGALTRRMRAVWVTAVLLLVGSLVADLLTMKLENKGLAALLDPFGDGAFALVTEYWTVSEKNARLPPLAGALLANRLLWVGLALALLAYTFRRFRMTEPLERAARRPPRAPPTPAALPEGPVEPPRPGALWARLSWLHFKETVKNVPFLLLVLAGVGFVLVAARMQGLVFGTPRHPVTYSMIELASGGFGLFQLIIVVLYAGELTWREREARLDQIVDALPAPTWVLFSAKLAALFLVGVLLNLVVMACGIGVQIAQGNHRLELSLYLADLFGLKLVAYFQMIAIALAVHTLVDHKAAGHFVMVLHYVLTIALPRFGFEHKLYRYGADSGYVYSDMNGFGHHLGAWAWWNAYWSLAAVILALLSNLFFVRGRETGLRARLREARRRLRGPARAGLVAATAAFVGTGAFIYYNTNVLNPYETSDDGRRRAVEYERKYKRIETLPQPLVRAVDVHYDLRPETGVVRVRGQYELANEGTEPIPTVSLDLPRRITVHRLALGGLPRPTTHDGDHGVHAFALGAPLAPGATTTLAFDLELGPRGFTGNGERRAALGNGTFIHNDGLPQIGYDRNAELADEDERRKHGLPQRPRIAALEDPAGLRRNYISSHAHRVRLRASVCTAPDQTAVMPGRLLRTWQEGGRRCFAYGADQPVLNFFSVLSARYAVRRDRFRDVDVEIHHHPGHEYNVERMIRAVKDSLEHFTTSFSPYPHRELRIVEFPRPLMLAQAFPGTIPYSEALGFIAKVNPEDEEDIDYPYYVTAHEVAHQWWGHELVGADVQGATLLSESLAQYSALMVMKRAVGPRQMRRFLRHELDAYLGSRGGERKKELPLARVEHQRYLHYNKASLAFYALADAVGEETINRALRALLAKWAGKGPPYARSVDLLAELRAQIPAERHGLLVDLFETITLYENRAVRAVARALPDGRWETRIEIAAKKLRADEAGKETEVPLDDEVDVGLVDARGVAVHLERLRLRPGVREAVVRTKERPLRAGVDPLNKLVDRQPDDNVVSVEVR